MSVVIPKVHKGGVGEFHTLGYEEDPLYGVIGGTKKPLHQHYRCDMISSGGQVTNNRNSIMVHEGVAEEGMS